MEFRVINTRISKANGGSVVMKLRKQVAEPIITNKGEKVTSFQGGFQSNFNNLR